MDPFNVALIALSIFVIVLVPFDLVAATLLVRLTRKSPKLPTLRSRAVMQVVLTIDAALGAFLAVLFLTRTHLVGGLITAILAAIILLPSVPGMHWLRLYFGDGFRDD